MLTILKGRKKLVIENRDLRAKNDALLKKNLELRDRLAQLQLRCKEDNVRTSRG